MFHRYWVSLGLYLFPLCSYVILQLGAVVAPVLRVRLAQYGVQPGNKSIIFTFYT